MGRDRRRREAPREGEGLSPRRAVLVAIASAAVAATVWAALGSIKLDPDREIAVVEIAGSTRLAGERFVWCPPGLCALSRYPRGPIDAFLPQAEEAGLPSAEGSRYGLRGTVALRLREADWRALHEAAGGRGIRGALVDAVRAAAPERPPDRTMLLAADSPHLRSIRGKLDAALDRRGLDAERLSLDGIDFLTLPPTAPLPPPTGARLLVVGLDGADWGILEPLLASGRLPNLERLVHDGARAKLLTVHPILSPVIWTTIATGVEPRRHGIVDFLVPDPDGGTPVPVTSRSREVPTVWEILSGAGVPVGIVGWWATWPADPVDGWLVADRVAYQLFGYRSDPAAGEGKTWPPELWERIRDEVVEPERIGWDEVAPFLEGTRRRPEAFEADEQSLLDDFRTLLASRKTYREIALRLRAERPVRLEAVYFEGTDTVAHLFMPYRDPLLAGVDPVRHDSFRAVVDRYYEAADRDLGRFLDGLDDDWTVMVLSDHGFAIDDTRPRSADSRIGHGAAAEWHRRFGMLVVAGASVRAGVELGEASVYDIAPTILALFGQPVPVSWPGRVLGEALDPGFLERHPVRYRYDDPVRRDRGDSLTPVGGAVAEDLMAKLRALGYVGGGEAGPSITTRNNIGLLLLADGRNEEAETAFREALEEAPGHPTLTVNLALALRRQGKDGEAEAALRDVMDRHPGVRRAAGCQLSQILVDRGDLAAAEGVLRSVLEVEPTAHEVLNALGLVLERQGFAVGAAEAFRDAARIDPNAADPRNNLGNLAKRSGKLDEAERFYREAIAADPYFTGAYNNLALILQERGRIGEAIELYGTALSKAPGNAIVRNNLASLYYATGDTAEARRLWEKAAEDDPDYASPRNNLAGLAITEGRLDEAEDRLDEALALDPGYGDARVNLALVLRARGRLDEALRELDLAAGDPAAKRVAVLQAASIELELGTPVRAVARLRPEAAARPRDVEIWNVLGEALLRAGSREEADAAWRRSLAIEPDQPGLRRRLEALAAPR